MSDTEYHDKHPTEERWHSLVKNMPGFVAIIGRDATITFVNRIPAGLTADQIIGSSISEFVPCRYRETILEKAARVFETGQLEHCEIIVSGNNGSSIWWSARLGPVQENGTIHELIMLCTDLWTPAMRQGRETSALESAKPTACVCAPQSLTDQTVSDGQISDRIRLDTALREGEEKFRNLAEHSLQGIFLIQDEKVVFANRRASEIMEIPHAELSAMGLDQMLQTFIHPDYREGMRAQHFRRLLGELPSLKYEVKALTLSGEDRWAEIHATTTVYGGRPAVQLAIADVTARKEAEQALRESEEKYRLLVENTQNAIFSVSRDGIFLFINSLAAERLGGKPEDFQGKLMMDYFPPEIARKQLTSIQLVIDSGKGEAIEAQTVLDDVPRWYLTSIQPLNGHDGKPRSALLIATDITETKSANQRLWEAESKYRSLVEQLPAITYTAALDEASATLYVSPQVETLLGLSQADYCADPDLWRGRLHPDDRDYVMAEVARCHATGEPFDCEYRVIAKDGRVLWFRDQAVLVRDDTGAPKLLQGVQFDITEQKLAQQALRESEARFERVAQHSREMVWEVDTEGVFKYVSHVCEEILGYRPDEMIDTMHFYDLQSEVVRDEFKAASLVQIARGESFYNQINKAQTKDGRTLWFLTSGTPVFDSSGNLRGYIGSDLDITERKRAEEALRSSQEAYRDLVENVSDVLYAVDRDLVITYVSPVVKSVLGYEPSEVVGQSVTSFIFSEDLPLIAAAARDLFNNRLYPSEYRMLTKTGEVRWIRSSSRPVLEGDDVVGARGVMTDITERKLAEDELRETKVFLDKIINSIGDPVIVKDQQHRYIVANDALCQVVGSSRDQLLGKSDPDFFPKEQAEIFWEQDDHVFATGEEDLSETKITDSAGVSRCIVTRKTRFVDTHGNKLIVGISRDITSRKRAEDELRETKIFLDKIINSIGDPVFVKDRQHRFVLANDAFCRLLGHSRDQVIGKSGTALFPQEQVDAFWEYDEHLFADGEEKLSEVTIASSGQCLFSKKTLYVDNGGNKFIVAVIRDITNRKRSEEVLKESKRQLIEAQRVAQLGNWGWDAVNKKLTWSDQISRICGLPIGEFEPDFEAFISLLHSDEHERFKTIASELASNAPGSLSKYKSGEFRIVRPEGSERVIHWRMEPVLDADGRLLRTFGIAQDVTERKQLETALQEVNRELEEERQALLQKNLALREVLGQIRTEADHVKLQIKTNLERLVMPTLLRVKTKAQVGDLIVVELLESLLKEVASPFVNKLENRFSNLTPRELEVCSMLQNSLQSKEIGIALGISVRTVEKFRQRIRLKLGMDKTEVNLTTYLRSL
jgi:PAS domain S-box-containing protein